MNSSDKTITIQQLRDTVEQFVQERDWQQYHSAKNLSISIACEAAELLELFQWVELKDSHEIVTKRKTDVEHELADIVVAVMCFCNRFNIDLSTIIMQKLEHNKQKYPIEKSKGKFTKYTQFIHEKE